MGPDKEQRERTRARAAWHDLPVSDDDLEVVALSHRAHSRENELLRAAAGPKDEPPMAFTPLRRDRRLVGVDS